MNDKRSLASSATLRGAPKSPCKAQSAVRPDLGELVFLKAMGKAVASGCLHSTTDSSNEWEVT